jgi:hypothetical protein
VSLRRDIHSALDVIAPPLGGMPERIAQTVLVDGAGRRRKEKMTFRLRTPLSLVAVFLVTAVVAAVLVGDRFAQDWGLFHSRTPAGDTYQSQVAQLQARPLHIPSPTGLTDCKSGPFNSAGDVGSMPVSRANVGSWTSNLGGVYYDYMFYTESKIAGPILVRARDLFTDQPVVFVGQYAFGPVLGTETIDGSTWKQRPYLLLHAKSPSSAPGTQRQQWNFIAGVPKNASGSTGWQIDGVEFSEVFLAC